MFCPSIGDQALPLRRRRPRQPARRRHYALHTVVAVLISGCLLVSQSSQVAALGQTSPDEIQDDGVLAASLVALSAPALNRRPGGLHGEEDIEDYDQDWSLRALKQLNDQLYRHATMPAVKGNQESEWQRFPRLRDAIGDQHDRPNGLQKWAANYGPASQIYYRSSSKRSWPFSGDYNWRDNWRDLGNMFDGAGGAKRHGGGGGGRGTKQLRKKNTPLSFARL